jgi:hypothetical protein
MNIALCSEDWQLFLAASTIQQCQSGSDFNDSTFPKHSHEPEPGLQRDEKRNSANYASSAFARAVSKTEDCFF